jgi:hypothetical protein
VRSASAAHMSRLLERIQSGLQSQIECVEDDERLECAEHVDGIAVVISADRELPTELRTFLDRLADECDGRREEDLERHNSNIKVHCPRAMAWKPKA